MKIKTLIVDDEAPARTRLRQLLQREPDFEIVGECSNGAQALVSIRQQQPDVVFLDIKMPRLSGLEVCQQLPMDHRPLIIFVTAFDRFALQAFEVHAVDYLLKPFDAERFGKTLTHVRDRLRRNETASSDPRLLALLEELKRGPQKVERLAFKTDGKVLLIRVEEIDWIEADGNYVRLHVGAVAHHLRETLAALEGQLPADKFLRVSRSAIVNLDRVKELQALFYGDYAVILKDGTRLNMSRHYRDRIEALLSR